MDLKELDESRWAALNEAHARPPVPMEANSVVRHYAFKAEDNVGQELVSKIKNGTGRQKDRYVIGTVDGQSIKLESHTEFVTCTIIGTNNAKSIPLTLEALLNGRDHQCLVSINIEIVERTKDLMKVLPFGERVFGGTCVGGIEVRTTLLPDESGCISFLATPGNSGSAELGRRIQRLLDMETYRIMALIGLPTARSTIAEIAALEDELHSLFQNGSFRTPLEEDAQTTLTVLMDLSARLSVIVNKTGFRTSASKAYFELVQQRLTSLEERKVGDLQTLTGFVRSRLDPAFSTIMSAEKRQQELAAQIDKALGLLRTQIDLDVSRSNKQSLESLNRRHRQQVLIAQAVEGLSIVAISYYAVGLLAYAWKSLSKAALLPVSAETATTISIPVVILVTFVTLKRLRKHWEPATKSGD